MQLSASKLAVEPALPHHAARGRREKILPPCRASEQARLTGEGRRSSCLSRSISRSRVHVFGGTTAGSLRSTPPSAAASPPPPPPPSPAAIAAVTRRHRRRHPPPSPPSSASRLPVKRAVAARLSATPATQNDNLRKLGTLANTKLERCQQRTRTAHRTARVAGSVRAWAAGVGARCYSGVTKE